METKKALRENPSGKFVTVITQKRSTGKVGSYEVRTVDTGRFRSAMKAANTVLRSAGAVSKQK